MAEVFSISGPPLGQTAPCPSGWQATPNGNCGAPAQGCPPEMRVGDACRSPAAVALQTALATLGKAVKDTNLAVTIDGFIGPETVKATNEALRLHSNQAAGRLRTGTLTQVQIANEALTITSVLAAELQRRGLQMPPLPVFKATAPTQAATVPVPVAATRRMPKALWALVAIDVLLIGTGLWIADRSTPSYRTRAA